MSTYTGREVRLAARPTGWPTDETFEIAEVTVDDEHWSLNGGGADLTAPGSGDEVTGEGTSPAGYGSLPPDADRTRPGFSGAAGNAC